MEIKKVLVYVEEQKQLNKKIKTDLVELIALDD